VEAARFMRRLLAIRSRRLQSCSSSATRFSSIWGEGRMAFDRGRVFVCVCVCVCVCVFA
jgi:hypothetical protein